MTYEEYKILADKLTEISQKFVDYNREMTDLLCDLNLELKDASEQNFAVKSSEATEEEILESNRQIQNDKN